MSSDIAMILRFLHVYYFVEDCKVKWKSILMLVLIERKNNVYCLYFLTIPLWLGLVCFISLSLYVHSLCHCSIVLPSQQKPRWTITQRLLIVILCVSNFYYSIIFCAEAHNWKWKKSTGKTWVNGTERTKWRRKHTHTNKHEWMGKEEEKNRPFKQTNEQKSSILLLFSKWLEHVAQKWCYKLIRPDLCHFYSTSTDKHLWEMLETFYLRKRRHCFSDVKHFNLLHLFYRPSLIKSKPKGTWTPS